MSPLLQWSLWFAQVCLVLAMLFALARLVKGPTAQDRVMAADCLWGCGLLMVLTVGLLYRSASYADAAVVMALFGFVSATAMAKFLLRGEVIE